MDSKPFALLGLVAFTLYFMPLVQPFTDLLQDFCVANTAEKGSKPVAHTKSLLLKGNAVSRDFWNNIPQRQSQTGLYVNGYPCKDPMTVEVNDFFLSGFDKEGDTNNAMGSKITTAAAKQIPGLYTLGLAMVRIDLAPYGVNPPHVHPRGSEMIVVTEGTMEVGFVTSAPNYKFFTKILNKGDMFVFPMGLVHYQRNNGSTKAVAIGAQSSQNAGVVSVPSSLFNCTPDMPTDMLGRVLQVDYNIIAQLEKKF